MFVVVSMEMWGVSLAWGQVNSLAKRFTGGNGRRKKLCMVPYHSGYIYATCRNNEAGRGERF